MENGAGGYNIFWFGALAFLGIMAAYLATNLVALGMNHFLGTSLAPFPPPSLTDIGVVVILTVQALLIYQQIGVQKQSAAIMERQGEAMASQVELQRQVFEHSKEVHEEGKARLKVTLDEIESGPAEPYLTIHASITNLGRQDTTLESAMLRIGEPPQAVEYELVPYMESRVLAAGIEVLAIFELTEPIPENDLSPMSLVLTPAAGIPATVRFVDVGMK